MADDGPLSEISSFIDLAQWDAGGQDAVRAALIEAGEPKPRSLLEIGTDIWNSNQAPPRPFAATELGKRRAREVAHEITIRGALAYVRGTKGNAFTRFLAAKFGEYDGPPINITWQPERRGFLSGALARFFAPLGAGLAAMAAATSIKGSLRFFRIFVFCLFVAVVSVLAYSPNDVFRNGAGQLGLVLALVAVFAFAGAVVERGVPFGKFAEWLGSGRDGSDSAFGKQVAFFGFVAAPVIGVLSGFLAIFVYGESANGAVLWFGCLGSLIALMASVAYLHHYRSWQESETSAPSRPIARPDTPSPASASVQIPVTMYDGCLQGARTGAKVFRATLHDVSPTIDVLQQLATFHSRLEVGPAWRIDSNPRTEKLADLPEEQREGLMDLGADSGEKYFADAKYRWANTAHFTKVGGEIKLRSVLPDAKTASGSGDLAMECVVIAPADPSLTVVQVVFNEPSRPMWQHRESEELIAKTLAEIAAAAQQGLHQAIEWKFLRGDWLHTQSIQAAQREVWLKSARG